MSNQFKKQEFKSIKLFKLKFPNLSLQERSILKEWSKLMGYQCILDDTAKKYLVINNALNRIAYIQKVKGQIRLVFNNRFEDITGQLIMTKTLKMLTPCDANDKILKFVLGSDELEYKCIKQLTSMA